MSAKSIALQPLILGASQPRQLEILEHPVHSRSSASFQSDLAIGCAEHIPAARHEETFEGSENPAIGVDQEDPSGHVRLRHNEECGQIPHNVPILATAARAGLQSQPPWWNQLDTTGGCWHGYGLEYGGLHKAADSSNAT